MQVPEEVKPPAHGLDCHLPQAALGLFSTPGVGHGTRPVHRGMHIYTYIYTHILFCVE